MKITMQSLQVNKTTLLALMALLMCISLPIQAKTTSRYDHAKAQYEETTTDMTVKVLGGKVAVKRRYRDGEWIFNPSWQSLKIVRTKPKSSLDGFTRGRGGDGVMTVSKPGEREYPIERIFRGQYRYKKAALLAHQSGYLSRYVYEHDPSKQILQSQQGYVWKDRTGELIAYDQQGHALYYQNANGVRTTLNRNSDGTISAVTDHLNQTVVEFDYQAGKVIAVRDYMGREVRYQWQGNALTQVTDVDGHIWRYGYQTLLDKPYINKITNPEDIPTVLTNAVSKGGLINAEEQGFPTLSRGRNSGSKSIRHPRSIEAESRVTLTGITYDDGKYYRYRTFYNVAEELYTTVTKSSDGVEVQKTFAKDGKPAEVSLGGKRLYTQIKSSNRRVIEDGLNNRTEIRYDQWDNPILVKHPDGSSESYSYHPVFNFPVEHRDRRGFVTNYRYDNKGNLLEVTEAAGTDEQRVIVLSYDSYGQVTTLDIAADAYSPAVSLAFYYDNYGNVIRYVDGRRGSWEFKDYTSDGQPRTVIDARKHPQKFDYLPSGRLSKVTSAMKAKWKYGYNKNGELTSVIDPLEQKTTISRSVRGEITTISDSLGQVAAYKYFIDGRVEKAIDGENRSQIYTYDRQLRLKAVNDEAGNATEYSYQGEELSALSWVSRVKRPEADVGYEYNSLGQPIKLNQYSTSSAESLVYQLTYNKSNQPEIVNDPQGRVTHTEYDAFGRVAKQVDALDGETTIHYTNLGLVASVTDAEDSTTRYEYDAQGNRTAEVLPMGQRLEYEYDANGNLTQFTTAEGQLLRYDYNDDNQLITEAWFNHADDTADLVKATRLVTYNYDLKGQLKNLNVSNSWGVQSTAYRYNARGEVINEAVTFPTFSKSIGYDYYRNGLLKRVVAPDGNEASYQYDKANRLSVATMKSYGSVVFSEYQGQLPKTMSYPGGMIRQQGYDGFGRLNDITVKGNSGDIVEQLAYQHDLAGNIISKSTKAGLYQYRYDKLDRLIEAKQPSPLKNLAFSYDAVGNRQTSSDEPLWDYNANHQLVQKGKTRYQYDANGNLTGEYQGDLDVAPLRRLIYNAQARLTEVQSPEGTLASYDYDPMGRRVARKSDGETQYFLYNHQGLIGEYDAQGNLQAGYQYPPDASWGTAPWYQATTQGAGGGFYQHDHLGAPFLMVRSNGETLWQGMYDAFGEVTETTALTPNNVRIPGQWLDRKTGYHYNYHRDYNPQLGRYVQRDPIGLAGGINTFAYVEGNPIGYKDPAGLFKVRPRPGSLPAFPGMPNFPEQAALGLCKTFGGVMCKNPPPEEDDGGPCQVDKDNPPNHPDFVPDKKKKNKEKIPWNKNRKGYKDKKGNYWEPVPDGHKGTHDPHWDVQHPNGTHTPVYPPKFNAKV